MPIYEYACTSCGNRTEILHRVDEEGPAFCPVCGTEGSMRKAFAPPAIVFKGSGWAKKERRSAATKSSSGEGPGDGGASGDESKGGDGSKAADGSKGGDGSKAADGSKGAQSADTSGPRSGGQRTAAADT